MNKAPLDINTVEIHLQDPDHPANKNKRLLTRDWTLARRLAGTWQTKKRGVAAAEEAFHILNAPQQLLTKEQAQLLKEFQQQTSHYHSLSVGDVVKVNTVEYLCTPTGWEKHPKPPEMQKHLLHETIPPLPFVTKEVIRLHDTSLRKLVDGPTI